METKREVAEAAVRRAEARASEALEHLRAVGGSVQAQAAVLEAREALRDLLSAAAVDRAA